MPQIPLNNADIDAFFQKVGCVGMTERMDGNPAFIDTGFVSCASECALKAVNGHGGFGFGCILVTPAQSRVNQNWISMGGPVISKHDQGFFRQGNVSIFGPFAPMHMDHHAFGVDIGNLQIQHLLKAKAAGINGGQKNIIVKRVDMA